MLLGEENFVFSCFAEASANGDLPLPFAVWVHVNKGKEFGSFSCVNNPLVDAVSCSWIKTGRDRFPSNLMKIISICNRMYPPGGGRYLQEDLSAQKPCGGINLRFCSCP